MAVPAHPDRRPGLLDRAGQHGVPGGVPVSAGARHRFAGPGGAHGDDRLVGELVALGVVDAERCELRFEVAGADADDDPTAREGVERRDRLRRQERVAVGGDQQVEVAVGSPGRRRRGEAQRDERVEGVVTTGGQPPVGRDRMVGHEDGVEAGRLGGPGDRRDGVGWRRARRRPGGWGGRARPSRLEPLSAEREGDAVQGECGGRERDVEVGAERERGPKVLCRQLHEQARGRWRTPRRCARVVSRSRIMGLSVPVCSRMSHCGRDRCPWPRRAPDPPARRAW